MQALAQLGVGLLRQSGKGLAVLALGLAAAQAAPIPTTANRSNDMSSFFSPPVATSVPLGGSYAGISTQVTAEQVLDGTAPTKFGTIAEIMAGTASAATTVNMQWRTSTLQEGAPRVEGEVGTSQVPPMNDSGGYAGVYSDVLKLTGIVEIAGGGSYHGAKQTDVFALQMTYNQAAVMASFHYGDTMDLTETQLAQRGDLKLGWLDLGPNGVVDNPGPIVDDVWTHSIEGNFDPNAPHTVGYRGPSAVTNFQGNWAEFVAAYPAVTTNLADFLGSWGVDTDDDVMWSVLNHNSQFAPIPEPGMIGVVFAAGLLVLRRRK